MPNWRPLAWLLAGMALLVLAAWTVPPMLDWGRFRTTIASIAAAQLGRPVVISGEISLRLLPDAVLTASDVTLADTGDGVSVQVAALRLQVATLPLLAGRVVVRDLVLSAPALTLPWSLPHGIGQSARPQVPHQFAARIENGRLRIGEAEVTGITAAVHAGPASGADAATPDGIPVAAFGAEGFAVAAGRSWRFTAALGAPDADGVSAVDIAVRGQGAVGDTGGSLQGTLADGVMQGRLRAGGPDLSLVMPASAAAWTAEAPFVADATRVEANAITLSLGGAPADGALVLHIENALPGSTRLEGHLHTASLDLNGWAALLGRSLRASPATGALIPLQIGLSAERALLLDGTLTAVQATLVSDGHRIGFDHAAATLPGGATLASEKIRLAKVADGQLAASGDASLSAPDLRATLAWLRRLAPDLGDALPAAVLRQAKLTGLLSLQAGLGSVSGLAGQVDGEAVTGAIALRLDGRPHLGAALDLAGLALDPWLTGTLSAGSLAGFAAHFTNADTSLHLRAAHATLYGQTLDGLDVTATTGAGGLLVEQAQAGLDGAKLSLAGAVAADGSLTGVRFTARADSLEPVFARLPTNARWLPDLWRGAGMVQVAADGPADAIALQVRADAGDLVLEADSVRDTKAATGTTTLTLRHPGAPRLFAELGLPQALGLPTGLAQTARWLDTGALALRAHFHDGPSHLSVQDFDLGAAALRLSGQLTADWSGAVPSLTGSLAFDQLALPDSVPDLKRAQALAAWKLQLHASAAEVSIGLHDVARSLTADLAAGGGKVNLTGVSAEAAGGKLTGEATTDTAAPRFTTHLLLAGATLPGPLTTWPIDLASGTADLDLTLDLAGTLRSDLSGAAHVQLRNATATGLDLAKLTAAAPLHTKGARLSAQAVLLQGTSPGLSGTLDATVSSGVVTLSASRLTSADGAMELTGMADLARDTLDVRVRLSPSTPGSASTVVSLGGKLQQPRAQVEAGLSDNSPGRAHTKRK